MSVWHSETARLSSQEKKVEHLFYFLLEHNVPGIADHVGKTFSLHRFLQAHKGEPDLWRRVLSRGKPIFTKTELARTLRHLRTQTGGSVGSSSVGSVGSSSVGISAGTDFFDKIINRFTSKMASFTTSSDPSSAEFLKCLFSFPTLPGVEPVITFLSLCLFMPWHAEQLPVVGPTLISPALDSVTLGLPASAEFLESLMTTLTVVPVIGSFAAVAATVVESILMAISTLLNLSRKQYGSAFQTSLGIVPHFGGSLMEAAQQLEKALERIQTRLNTALVPMKEFTATGAAAAQQYIPSLEEYTGPSVPLTMETIDKIKAEVFASLQEKAKQDVRFQQLQTLIQSVTTQLTAIVPITVLEALKNNDIPGALRALQAVVLPPQLLESVGKLKELMASFSDPSAMIKGTLPTMPQMPQMPTMSTMPQMPSMPQMPTMNSVTSNLKKRKNSFKQNFVPSSIRKRKTRRYRRR